MPRHLLRGHLRLSTVLIALVFIATLTTYLLVRPVPASGTDPRTPPGPTGQATTAPPTPTPAVTSRTPTTAPGLSHTPTASPPPSDAQVPTSPDPTR
ncbi:hypothetical protein [Virgisporangium aurantiacum]|uniref:Uncharacterized protein n=1 Tax=Virgisporangium aurantiacum TaxID=175570 RepID=A0A8J4DYB9_9ACTN|nr:hypothetical protein [Virgisporangium aurantiacum]GIJ54476.1 hypothetical protein Vau01_019920 [Virgisporangium aurantiacum]